MKRHHYGELLEAVPVSVSSPIQFRVLTSPHSTVLYHWKTHFNSYVAFCLKIGWSAFKAQLEWRNDSKQPHLNLEGGSFELIKNIPNKIFTGNFHRKFSPAIKEICVWTTSSYYQLWSFIIGPILYQHKIGISRQFKTQPFMSSNVVIQ